MLDSDTIAAGCRLLGLYKGVTVEHFQGHPFGRASFILRITDPTSVARLAYCASDACVDFLVWPVGHAWPIEEGIRASDPRVRSEEDWASPNLIRYQLRAEPSSGDEGEPELRVVVLCVCMADQLADLGVLSREEASQLRAGWGF
jgi:hypothetical protein